MAELKIFLTNLGKYNEGELVGKWFTLPLDEDEQEEALESIGIGSVDEFGQPYEEFFISDYECDVPGIEIDEYESLENCNAIAEALDSLYDSDIPKFGAIAEEYDVQYALETLANNTFDDFMFYEGVSSDTELAEKYISDVYGDVEDMPADLLERYFDFEAFGRQYADEYYPVDDEDPEDAYELFGVDNDYDLGWEATEGGNIKEMVSSPEYYFDYDQFGRDLSFDGGFTSEGFLFNR